MKLVTYLHKNEQQLGLLIDNNIYNLKLEAKNSGFDRMPDNMRAFLTGEDFTMSKAKEIDARIKAGEQNPR